MLLRRSEHTFIVGMTFVIIIRTTHENLKAGLFMQSAPRFGVYFPIILKRFRQFLCFLSIHFLNTHSVILYTAIYQMLLF